MATNEEYLEEYELERLDHWTRRFSDPTDMDSASMIRDLTARDVAKEKKRLEAEWKAKEKAVSDEFAALMTRHGVKGRWFKILKDGTILSGRIYGPRAKALSSGEPE